MSTDFELAAAGKSQVKNLSITAATAKISLKKNAAVNMVVRADRGIEVSTDNNSTLDLSYDAENLTLEECREIVADESNISKGGARKRTARPRAASKKTES